MLQSDLGNIVKKTHKKWRAEVKKFRRKRLRQKFARERDKELEKEEQRNLKDPNYIEWMQQQEHNELLQKQLEDRKHEENEKIWLKRELKAHKKFQEEKNRQQAIQDAKEKERQRIQKEFEEQERLITERIEQKKRLAEEELRKHELLLQKIQDYINGCAILPEELRQTADTNPDKPLCPFFMKTASCRFGDKCSRNHSRPGISRTLLFPHFFTHIRLEQCKNTEYGNDIPLEFTEAELYREYCDFFKDVISELTKHGKINNFQTCQNSEIHLRGNVYVEYFEERDALQAYQQLQGRYYAGKRINIEFCSLSTWKAAICGTFSI